MSSALSQHWAGWVAWHGNATCLGEAMVDEVKRLRGLGGHPDDVAGALRELAADIATGRVEVADGDAARIQEAIRYAVLSVDNPSPDNLHGTGDAIRYG